MCSAGPTPSPALALLCGEGMSDAEVALLGECFSPLLEQLEAEQLRYEEAVCVPRFRALWSGNGKVPALRTPQSSAPHIHSPCPLTCPSPCPAHNHLLAILLSCPHSCRFQAVIVRADSDRDAQVQHQTASGVRDQGSGVRGAQLVVWGCRGVPS